MPIGRLPGGTRKEDTKTPENSMANLATYEQLLSAWEEINEGLDPAQISQHGTLAFYLKNIYSCFTRPPFECDSGVKSIFENTKLREGLKGAGIAEEFLLHTVRMGAIKGIQTRLERTPGQPVELYSDGTMSRLMSQEIESGRLESAEAERERLVRIIRRLETTPTLDGYSWANQGLKVLEEEKKNAQNGKLEADKQQTEKNKLVALDRIKKQMSEPDFRLTPEDATLLRQDFANKLVLWKAVLESGVGAELNYFLEEYGDSDLTPEIFAKFKSFYETNTKIQAMRSGRPDLPLEIIDPESGWFSVLIVNKQTKLREFIRSAYGNMNSWFLL